MKLDETKISHLGHCNSSRCSHSSYSNLLRHETPPCRSAADYAAGHIPGAINIGIGSLLDNLDKIDPDAPVYVYCYTGHTAAQEAALLQVLGYEAYSLKFGMCSWSSDPAVNMGKCFDASTVLGYDVE